jgi:alpha-glucosidase
VVLLNDTDHAQQRTFWNRDAYGMPSKLSMYIDTKSVVGVPSGTNLYGEHAIYFEHRTTGTHGVFLLNSNGMDIKLRPGSLEYNIIGGILDFYFLAGPEPLDVAKQYAAVVGTPAEIPYWGLGLHQCRYGYQNYLEVAQVVANYSAAGIPLETMWTDSSYFTHVSD